MVCIHHRLTTNPPPHYYHRRTSHSDNACCLSTLFDHDVLVILFSTCVSALLQDGLVDDVVEGAPQRSSDSFEFMTACLADVFASTLSSKITSLQILAQIFNTLPKIISGRLSLG